MKRHTVQAVALTALAFVLGWLSGVASLAWLVF